MKKRNISLAILATTALIALPAFADTSVGVSANVNANVTANKDLRANLKTEVEAQKADIKDARAQISDDRMQTNVQVANNRVQNDVKIFTATTNRLDKIIVRIKARIAKIKSAGGDTTAMQTNLDAGISSLAEARADISIFSSIDLTSATSTTTARTLLTTIKSDAVKARLALQATRTSLLQAVSLMIGVEGKLKTKIPDTDVQTSGSASAGN